ncbi:hypothetical protein PUN28_013767 [Cardiocondyla obscurior]|uniref:Uncharacterized protein n=1 Tax=Cardiocondyla obscurior TaxID=286306 RepID=A0AAW2F2U7_9HYME
MRSARREMRITLGRSGGNESQDRMRRRSRPRREKRQNGPKERDYVRATSATPACLRESVTSTGGFTSYPVTFPSRQVVLEMHSNTDIDFKDVKDKKERYLINYNHTNVLVPNSGCSGASGRGEALIYWTAEKTLRRPPRPFLLSPPAPPRSRRNCSFLSHVIIFIYDLCCRAHINMSRRLAII